MDNDVIKELDKYETTTAEFDPDYNPGYKLYSYGQTVWGTFCFGTLAGIVFLSRNFKRMGKPKASKKLWRWGIIALAFQVLLAMFLPKSLTLFAATLSIVYWGIIIHISSKYQRETIEYHLDQGEEKHSIGHVIGNGLLFLIIWSFAVLLIVFITSVIIYFIYSAQLNSSGILD